MNIEYSFNIQNGVPVIIKIIIIDGVELDRSILDISSEYKNLPIETLYEFSNFLSDRFNYFISDLVEKNLNQYTFNTIKQPIENICIMKTSCEELISSIEESNSPEEPSDS